MVVENQFIQLIDKLKNALFYFGSSLLTLVFSVFTFPIYSAYLSAEDFGLLGYFLSLKSFIYPLFLLQMVRFYLMVYFRQSEIGNGKTLFNIVAWLSIWNLILSSLILLIGPFLFDSFNVSFPFFPFAILIVSQSFFDPFKSFLLQQYRIRKEGAKYFLIASLVPILNASISLLLMVQFGLGVTGRLGGIAFSAVLTGGLSIFFLRKFMITHFSFKDFTQSLKTISPLIIGVFFYLPTESIDRIVLERLKMPEELGFYSIGLQISGYFLVASTAVFKAFEPEFFSAVIRTDRKKIISNLFQFLSVIILGFIFFQVLLVPIVLFLTKSKFEAAIPYCRYLLVAKFISSFGLVGNAFILAKKEVRKNSYVMYISGVSALIFYPVLVSLFGFQGALFARIIVPSVVILSSLVFIYYSFTSKPVGSDIE